MFENKYYLDFIKNSKKKNLDIVIITVIHTKGSTYAKIGNVVVCNSELKLIGVLGSDWLHNKLISVSKSVLETKKCFCFVNKPSDKSSHHGESTYFIEPFFHKDRYSRLDDILNNFNKTIIRDIQSGEYDFTDTIYSTKLIDNKFYQKIKPPYSLLIFGHGIHIKPLIDIANLMSWKTTIIDTKIDKEDKNISDRTIKLKDVKDIFNIDLEPYNAGIVLSHSTKKDGEYIQALIKSKIDYIGVMGNKHKAKEFKEKFNLNNDNRFFAPIGLDIGGRNNLSIALSICAQIESKKNEKI